MFSLNNLQSPLYGCSFCRIDLSFLVCFGVFFTFLSWGFVIWNVLFVFLTCFCLCSLFKCKTTQFRFQEQNEVFFHARHLDTLEIIWLEWHSSLILVFSHFRILVWTQPYEASGNWIIHVFATVFIKKKKWNATTSSCPHVPPLYFPALWRACWLLRGKGSRGCVQNLQQDSLFPICCGTEYESKKGGLSHFPDTLGVLIMVTHQCLNTSLLHCIWCCIADVFGCTFFIIKMYKTYILK